MVDCSRNSRRQRVPSPVSSDSSASARTSASRKQARAAPGGSVPTSSQACTASASGASRAPAGRRPSGVVRAASQASTAPDARGEGPPVVRDAGAGEAVADGGVDEHVESVGDQRAGSARAARAGGQLGPGDGRRRRDQGLDGREVDTLHDGPPAGAGDRPRAVEGREHVAAAGEVVGERGDGPQVGDRGAVAQLVGRVVELGGVDGDGGHRPRPQLGFAAWSRGAGRADELGGGHRATGVRRQQQRDLGGRAGVQRGQGVGGRGEGMRPGGAQGPAAPGGRPFAVLGPEQHAPPRRPQGVHHQHPATLRPPRRRPGATGSDRSPAP